MTWEEDATREEGRYADAVGRLPEDPARRQKQLVRAAMTAGGAGLARLMQGRDEEATAWFLRSAERYRESWADAPPESWGRLIGALKARLLAADRAGGEEDARWALEQSPGASASPIGWYAAVLAELVLGRDREASTLAARLRTADDFPPAVSEALEAVALRDPGAYADACAAVLASFESREDYLEDLAVADTVIVLEALAERRGMAARPGSSVLPP